MARTAESLDPKYLTTRCRRCGQAIASNAIVCYKCGAPTADPPAPRPAASRSAARTWVFVALGAVAVAVVVWLTLFRH